MPVIHNDNNAMLRNQFSYFSYRLFKTLQTSQNKTLSNSNKGPVPFWPLGNAQDFLKQPIYKVLENYNNLYGNTVLFWISRQANVLLVNPEDIKVVVEDSSEDVFKNSPKKAAGKYFRRSVFFANGSEWKNKRNHHPLSHPKIDVLLNNSVNGVRHLTSHHIGKMKLTAGFKSIQLFNEMTELSFDIFSNFLLGHDATSDLFETYIMQMEDMHRRGTKPASLPNPWVASKARQWRAYVEGMLNKVMQGEVRSRDNLPQWFSSENNIDLENFHLIRDEISTSFYAGTRNVASAISFLMQLLASHTEKYDVLQRSIDSFLDEHPNGYTYEDLKKLDYLDCAVKESLRLYPIVPAFFREVLPGHSIELPSISLPEKTQIFISSWVIHRNKDIWESPDEYKPERFYSDPEEFSYLPFGAGPRICVGMTLSLMITKVVAVELCRKIRFKSILPMNDSHVDNEYFSGIVIPSDGLLIDAATYEAGKGEEL